jgi:hypothetical protein
MAVSNLASFLFGRTPSKTKFGEFLVVDVTSMITTTYQATVTSNPVQRGAVINDHVKLEPLIVKMDCFISDAPIGTDTTLAESLAGGVAGSLAAVVGQNSKVGGLAMLGTGIFATAGSKLGNYMAADATDRGSNSTWPQMAFDILRRRFESQAPFTLYTYFYPKDDDRNIYQNMVMTSLEITHSPNDGGGLRFSVTAQKIRVVTLLDEVLVDPSTIKGLQAANSAATKRDLGKQGTKAASDKAARDASSAKGILDDIYDTSQDVTRNLNGLGL